MGITISSWKEHMKQKMKEALEHLSSAFASVRSGRAHTGMLENIVVEAYDQKTPLKQLATVTTPKSQELMVRVWDGVLVHQVDKAIKAENLVLNTVIEGSVFRFTLPPMSQERREEMVKIVIQKAENARVVLRNLRRTMMDAISKLEGVGKDDVRNIQKQVQKIIDDFMEEIHLLTERKKTEIIEK